MPPDEPRLWVVDPSLNHPESQGVETLLEGWPGESKVFQPGLRPGDGPTPRHGYDTDGIVLMGSAASVHDDRPWLQPLSSWLGPVVAGRVQIPLLGICFGHQLIAHLAGGRVGPLEAETGKRVGVATSRLQGSRLLPGVEELRVVVSHREIVGTLPAGYQVTARRPGVDIDGLEHESLPVFAYQFHPEAREEFAGHAGIPVGEIDEGVRRDSRRLLGAFRERARKKKPAG